MTGRVDSRLSAAVTFGAGFVTVGLLLDVVSVFALDWWDRGHQSTRSAAIAEGIAWLFRDQRLQAVTFTQIGLILAGPALAAYFWGVPTAPDSHG